MGRGLLRRRDRAIFAPRPPEMREIGAVMSEHGFFESADDVFYLNIHEVHEALSDLGLAWSGGTPARGTVYWPPRIARRKEILAKLSEWTPPPALGVVPEVINDPTVQLLWGVTADRLREPAQRIADRLKGLCDSK